MQGQVTSVKAGSTRSEGVDLLGSATVLLIKSLFLCSMDGLILSSLYSVSLLRNPLHGSLRINCFSLSVVDSLELLYQPKA